MTLLLTNVSFCKRPELEIKPDSGPFCTYGIRSPLQVALLSVENGEPVVVLSMICVRKRLKYVNPPVNNKKKNINEINVENTVKTNQMIGREKLFL
ncbi:hypothetical protein FHS16_003925 [Paenibacillus endophyticus]|uniref:Uncharacterized protein n=1 Tax=Paenibacillus endophyticus TaxID=1294268 RepID=A0A7W5GBI7_9BACL|nr:hypothetical protein [Paenibacillus endophyticus]